MRRFIHHGELPKENGTVIADDKLANATKGK